MNQEWLKMAKYCTEDVRATIEMFKNAPEEPLYKDIYDSSISRKPVRNKKELKERLKKQQNQCLIFTVLLKNLGMVITIQRSRNYV